MAKLIRFGVSIEANLLEAFDRASAAQKYANRSQAIADLMRNKLIERDWQKKNAQVVATVSLVYNHHRREVVNKVMDIQHDYQRLIISTQHIHLDHDNCLEIIASKGKARDIVGLTHRLRGVKGTKHVSFTATTSGKQLS
ncbi:MAG: nickel-responsive transcriptional regulator NikR [Candidatus Omnitrophica bacterium]|nr:nickel-responsive transcriptional regulator NikR [Candidatus Omnitrophota bacterium]